GEERAETVDDFERAFAVFALVAFLHFAAEKLRENLNAETDSEYGHAELENALVRQRRVFRVNTGWTAGQNDAFGANRGDFLRGRVVAQDDGIDVALAN